VRSDIQDISAFENGTLLAEITQIAGVSQNRSVAIEVDLITGVSTGRVFYSNQNLIWRLQRVNASTLAAIDVNTNTLQIYVNQSRAP